MQPRYVVDMANAPTLFELSHLLRYEPETGGLFWLPRPAEMFLNGRRSTAAQAAAAFNRRFAGRDPTVVGAQGYKLLTIAGRKFLAHRLIWKMVHNVEPEQIDHINGVRTDNRLVNLRSVTQAENAKNFRKSRRNTSGVTGVNYRKDRGVWRAFIHVGGKIVHLGTFPTIEKAAEARRLANIKYGFHPNHGTSLDDASQRIGVHVE